MGEKNTSFFSRSGSTRKPKGGGAEGGKGEAGRTLYLQTLPPPVPLFHRHYGQCKKL